MKMPGGNKRAAAGFMMESKGDTCQYSSGYLLYQFCCVVRYFMDPGWIPELGSACSAIFSDNFSALF